jgi:preprotein translocase subunit SecG
MGFIYGIHIITCVLLVICILMQAGRGGGLTETFQSAESMFGTQTNAFMVRMTTIFAVIFLSTSLILAFNSSKGDKSLMANKKLMAAIPKTVPPVKTKDNDNDVQVKVESPKPMAAPETTTEAKEVPVSPVTNAAK